MLVVIHFILILILICDKIKFFLPHLFDKEKKPFDRFNSKRMYNQIGSTITTSYSGIGLVA